VKTQSAVAPVQSIYVQVYVFVPEQTGSTLTTGPVTVNGSPHELSTEGFDGTTWASAIQSTVALPAAGKTNVGGLMVYVNTHGVALPEQSVYVHVYVLVPEHIGSGETTGPAGITGSPHESFTFGGVGTIWASAMHGTVALPFAGSVKVAGVIV
jgi:hypothetical protein